ncbi:ABC transporter ATP-binding protein [Candidatus Saccharibacteria bacterium]|nr:ABC transporter ATP-binding protein [Candidatus Saccharibacteria bacterium]
MIEVQHVTKTYGKKHHFVALDDVSFVVPSGTSVAVIGKSGSGKSTLMHAISGLDRPESGRVIIDGDDILLQKKQAVDNFRATKMSFIFQSFFVQANETCYDNVSLPLEIAGVSKKKRMQKVRAALESVELGDKIKSRARDLSGGQKQRLAIARAIVNEPTILFADEPTGNLDSATGDVIEKLLFDYCKKNHATLIIVTHDHDLASKCDMQIYIKDGKITNINGSRSGRTSKTKINIKSSKARTK